MPFLILCIWIVWLADDEKISGNLSPVQQDSQNPFMLLSMLPTMLPKLGQSRVPPLTAGLQFQVSGSQRASLHFHPCSRSGGPFRICLFFCFFFRHWQQPNTRNTYNSLLVFFKLRMNAICDVKSFYDVLWCQMLINTVPVWGDP